MGAVVLGTAAGGARAWAPRPADAAPAAVAPVDGAAGDIAPVEVAPGLLIRPRAAWAQGRDARAAMAAEEVRFLLVHHTASSNTYRPEGIAGVLRSAYDFHTGPSRGWPDVCYHFFVDRFGGVWEGRTGSIGGPVVADATGGNQGHAQLVCLVGDFSDEMPSPDALASLERVLAWLAERYAIDTTPGATAGFTSRGSNLWPAGEQVTVPTIAGHRDTSRTECPGDTFYPLVRDGLAARVAAVRAAPGDTAPDASAGAQTAPPAAPSGTVTAQASAPATSRVPTVSRRTLPASAPATIPTWTSGGVGLRGGVVAAIAAATGVSAVALARRRPRSEPVDADREPAGREPAGRAHREPHGSGGADRGDADGGR